VKHRILALFTRCLIVVSTLGFAGMVSATPSSQPRGATLAMELRAEAPRSLAAGVPPPRRRATAVTAPVAVPTLAALAARKARLEASLAKRESAISEPTAQLRRVRQLLDGVDITTRDATSRQWAGERLDELSRLLSRR
jgi:hypothetical protein